MERDEALEEIQRLESYIQILENNFINAIKTKESQDMILEDRKNQIAELNKSVKDLQSELIGLAKNK